MLDPIDGNKSFYGGAPTFGTLIAPMPKGVPVVGIIDQPISLRKMDWHPGAATTGRAAHLRAPHQALLILVQLYWLQPPRICLQPRLSDMVSPSCNRPAAFTRFGLDCYAYGLLAVGQIDLVCKRR